MECNVRRGEKWMSRIFLHSNPALMQMQKRQSVECRVSFYKSLFFRLASWLACLVQASLVDCINKRRWSEGCLESFDDDLYQSDNFRLPHVQDVW